MNERRSITKSDGYCGISNTFLGVRRSSSSMLVSLVILLVGSHVHVIHICCSSPEPVLLARQEKALRHFCASIGHSSSLLLGPVCLAQFPLGQANVHFPASTRVERVKLPCGQDFQNLLDL